MTLPTSDDTFLWRICKALDVPPRMLAAAIGVPFVELEPLLLDKATVPDMDQDEVWWLIYEFTGRRIGELMAVRAVMDRALQKDRRRRVTLNAYEPRKKGYPRGP